MNRALRAVLALAGIVISTAAHAFDPKVHARYTVHAGSFLRACEAHGVTVPEEIDIDVFAGRTEAEDAPTPARAANWHYARNDYMGRYFVYPIQMNLDRIFDHRVKALFAHASSGQCKRSELFGRAGSIAHYIQDMRVPAHVIPINHGSIFGPDAFDKYPFRYDVKAPTRDECRKWAAKAVTASGDTLASLLAGAREDTRTRIRGPLVIAGKEVKCSWTKAFWCTPSPEEDCKADFPGFGTYRASKFGDLHVACDGGDLRVTDDDYHVFFRDAYRLMLEDTAIVLLTAHNLAAAHKCAR